MKRNIYFFTFTCILGLWGSSVAFAQEEEDNRPIRPPFGSEILIDNQTTVNPSKGGFAMEIQHRFSKIEKIDNIFGIYGSANTRIGFTYGVTDWAMVGIGTTRDYMLQDLNWKFRILTQTRSGKIPLSLSYFGNAVLDARPDENFGPTENYKFIHRLSYLNQLIVSRAFGNKVSLQIAPTLVYQNSVPEGFRNANASIYAGGRFQVLGFHSIILEYNQPILKADEDVHPNLAAGVEIGTSTHSFRIFVTNYNSIMLNRSIAFNQNNFFDGDIMVGFNITVRFR
jgi:hypothetical protein